MTTDFQVVFPQEVVRLSHVRTVPGVAVRTIEVVGEDFSAVEDVLINGISAPDVVVLGASKLVAQVPEGAVHQTITSVTVLSRRLVLTPKSLIRLRIGRTPGKVRGVLRLMQVFLKVLFTTPGTDIFAPRLGGGALVGIGQTFDADDGASIISRLVVSVDSSARQLIQIQARSHNLPPDERLLSARVVEAGFNRSETALLASIELRSQAGRVATARLEL